ncbi:MAG: hypothetical protein KY475_24220 [Planctomycetes bacterium]|nr:hypothetical protein [Planctomycetota bacterium]
MSSQQFWPCTLSFKPTPEELRFLETALAEGHRPYVCEISDFGADADSGRAGQIVVRGRSRRELVLIESRKSIVSVFVSEFKFAADALLMWLGGAPVETVLEHLKDHLVVMPGMTSSYIFPHANADTSDAAAKG